MNETYDQIVLGTGLKECIISGLLSVAKNKVLHMDRNDFYGAECASLSLQKVFTKFTATDDGKEDQKVDMSAVEAQLGRSKDYNIDLCPKFIMACGDLVKLLLHTKVTRYLDFKCVDGSYVYKAGAVHPVPMTASAALSSQMLGLMSKRRYKNFLTWVLDVSDTDKKTWATGWSSGWGGAEARLELDQITMAEVYKYWNLDEDTQEFTGHAIALYPDESYLNDKTKTIDFLMRLKLYAWSLSRYKLSPYIYPVYGLGGLPESFSRLAAVHGGTYMLRYDVEEILYNEDGTVKGVRTRDGEAACKQLIGDPTYFLKTDPPMVKKTGQIARWICILKNRVPKTTGDSAQIIIPQKQAKRNSDIYISVMSAGLMCCPQGKFVAMLSCAVEGTYDTPDGAKRELQNATKILGANNIAKDFFYVCDKYEPVDAVAAAKKNIFITCSMDETTHFQSCTKEVMSVFEQITGNPVNLEADPEAVGTDAQFE